MLVIIYKLTGNSNLLYLLALFAITFLSLPYSFSKFFVSLLLMANILFLIISLDVLIVRRYHIQFAGVIGTIYALTTISFSLLLYFGTDYTELWWFLPNFMLALLLLMLHLDKKYYALISPKAIFERKPHIKKVFFGLTFMRYTLYLLGVASLTFIATVAVHELGHAITARYYDCEPTRIIYDLRQPPYTEISCPASGSPIFIITIAGTLLVFAASAIFYFTKGPFTTRLAELMLGFGFLISYNDLIDLGISSNIILLVMMIAFIIILLAIINFSLLYIRQHTPVKKEVIHEIKKYRKLPLLHANRRGN
jgi:hypothetical protein